MSEAMIGYLEAAFMALGLVLTVWLLRHLYHPRRRDEMEAHGRRIIESDDDEGGRHGQT